MATAAPITGAPTGAPSIPASNRRTFLGALAFAPLGAALPTVALAQPSTFRVIADRHRVATKWFNGLPEHLETTDPAAHDQAEAFYLATFEAVEEARIDSWDDFAEAFDIMTSGGSFTLSEHMAHKLCADAMRLSGRA